MHAEQSHEDAVDVDVEPLAVVEEDEPLDVLDLDEEEEDDLEELFFFVAYAKATAAAVVGAGQSQAAPVFLSFP